MLTEPAFMLLMFLRTNTVAQHQPEWQPLYFYSQKACDDAKKTLFSLMPKHTMICVPTGGADGN